MQHTLFNTRLEQTTPTATRFEAALTELGEHGWTVVPAFLDSTEIDALATEAAQRHRAGDYHRAGVGHGDALQVRDGLRRDEVLWLDNDIPSLASGRYLRLMEEWRRQVNQAQYLGLFDFECHFAHYGPGAFYRRHLDRFNDDDRRTLTAILYLNRNWQESDGGQLRFYPGRGRTPTHIDIPPQAGTWVSFLSGEFEHEVLPAQGERLSITGWFRRRPI